MNTKKVFKRELTKITLFMKESYRTKKEVDLVCFTMKIKTFTLDIGKEIKSMVKGFTTIITEIVMKVISKTESNKAVVNITL